MRSTTTCNMNDTLQPCVGCHAGKTWYKGGIPCKECHTSIPEEQRTRSSMLLSPSLNYGESQSYYQEKRKKWINYYFEIFHPRWPLIYRGTFDISGEQSAESAAVELNNKLDFAIRDQSIEVEGACSSCFWPIAIYQAILLHVILSIIMKADGVVNLDLKASIPTTDLELLKSLVRSCQKLGMFFYLNMLARYKEVDLPSFAWVVSSFSTDNSPLLHARELQFLLPSNDPLWNSVKRNEWEANAKDETISLKITFKQSRFQISQMY
ncbi:hypothetical protein BDV09DRAFT_188390 [Aspergillus tetrazonus]